LKALIIALISMLSLLAFTLLYPNIKQKNSFFIKEVYDNKILLKNNGTEVVNVKMLIVRCGGRVVDIKEPNICLKPGESLEIEVNLSSINGCELTFISSDGAWISSLVTSSPD